MPLKTDDLIFLAHDSPDYAALPSDPAKPGVRLDGIHGKEFRVVNVAHKLWPKIMAAVTIPIIVLAEIASEVPDDAEDE